MFGTQCTSTDSGHLRADAPLQPVLRATPQHGPDKHGPEIVAMVRKSSLGVERGAKMQRARAKMQEHEREMQTTTTTLSRGNQWLSPVQQAS
jgi:hypothetical protein